MNTFPADLREWKNDVSHRLMRLRGTINDIMIAMPQIPDPEIGQPFTGPLSPVPFVWPTQVSRSGGTVGTLSTAANHCSFCPTALRFYEITVAGITNRSCTLCNSLNGTFLLEAQDGLQSGGGIVGCMWYSPSFTWCSSNTARWVMSITSTEIVVYWERSGAGQSPEYRRSGCPPTAGSGSGTVTLNRSSSALNDCRDYPSTITLRGIA